MITAIYTLDGFTLGDNLIRLQLIVQVDYMSSAFVPAEAV